MLSTGIGFHGTYVFDDLCVFKRRGDDNNVCLRCNTIEGIVGMFAPCGDVGDVGAVATTWVVGFVGFGERVDIIDGSCLALDVFLNVFGAIPKHFDARLAVFV